MSRDCRKQERRRAPPPTPGTSALRSVVARAPLLLRPPGLHGLGSLHRCPTRCCPWRRAGLEDRGWRQDAVGLWTPGQGTLHLDSKGPVLAGEGLARRWPGGGPERARGASSCPGCWNGSSEMQHQRGHFQVLDALPWNDLEC